MASFGHVAVGLLTARLHGGAPTRARPRTSWGTLALFAALATLPDADVALVALGASDAGSFGHRGAMHSLGMALAVGLLCAIAARRWHWPVVRTALAGAAAIASHTLLDLLDNGGKSLAVFWPLSSVRYHLPWSLLPDAPRGLGLLSRAGLLEFTTEFAIFLPVTIYALWPHVVARAGRSRPSSLRLIAGEGAVAPTPASSPKSVESDPPLRSSG
jgi:inner membrane protein